MYSYISQLDVILALAQHSLTDIVQTTVQHILVVVTIYLIEVTYLRRVITENIVKIWALDYVPLQKTYHSPFILFSKSFKTICFFRLNSKIELIQRHNIHHRKNPNSR